MGKLTSLLLFMALPAYSQFFSIGVKAGVPLTDAYSTNDASGNSAFATLHDQRYIIGPTAEVHLPFHFSFEADALYRRDGFSYNVSPLIPPVIVRTGVNDWQIPLLGKYELRFGPIRPFVDAGVVYRHASASGSSSLLVPNNPNSAGFTAGGGVTLNLFLIRLSPEIRYSHWSTPPFTYGNGAVVPYIPYTANQADFLVGITF